MTKRTDTALRLVQPDQPPVSAGALADDLLATLATAREAIAPRMAEHAARRAAEEQAARERQIIEAAAAEAREHEARVAALRRAGVPAKHLRVLLGLPDDDGAVVVFDPKRYPARVAARWRTSRHHTLVLGGAIGAGKSLAACWLVQQGPRRPYPHPDGYDASAWPDELRPRYVHAARLARLSTYGRGGDPSEVDLLERCALLVIDEIGGVDVGVEKNWIARLDSIVAVRADNELDTIMTTNLRVEDTRDGARVIPGFRTLFGERILDRMRGDGRCWVESGGASQRTSANWEGVK